MRATGKTFRAVLQALIYASNGYTVIYGSNHHRHAYDMCKRMVGTLQFSVIKVDNDKNIIKFDNGGYIHFRKDSALKHGEVAEYSIRDCTYE